MEASPCDFEIEIEGGEIGASGLLRVSWTSVLPSLLVPSRRLPSDR